MFEYFAFVVSGIALLVWSADRFTDGAAAIARNFGVSPLIVGLTIVAIGSSAPEIVVSANASLQDKGGLGLGNALGSNITNIAFVLGIAALVKPLQVESGTLRREFPLLIGITLYAAFLLLDGDITRLEGLSLLVMLAFYLGWLIHIGMKSRARQDLMLKEIVEELPESMPNNKALFWVVIGMVLLQVSSNLLVMGAENIARHYGVSEVVIGATVIAIGTSLPELAASVAGVLKDEDEMALGNVIGSNIFNLLAVMSLPGVFLGSFVFTGSVIYLNVYPMVALTIALGLMGYGFKKSKGTISRIEGGLLLAVFVGWLTISALHEMNAL